MFPQRRLLYHRGVDDHVGTYVTDYVFAGVCFTLFVHLIIRMLRERRMMTIQQTMTSSCRNLLPWNWPKEQPTPVTVATYAVLLLGLSNGMMALLGGLTHQFLQTVEPYTGDANELRTWLIVWRGAASFSAGLCLSLLTMTEQLIVQECLLRIPRVIRIIYYVIIFGASIVFFCYNYVALSGEYEDPFSVRQSFIVSFGVMFVYAFATIAVLLRKCCCRSRNTRPYFTDNDVRYSPAYSVDDKRTDSKPYSKEIYSCCKTMAVHCNNKEEDVTSRRWEMFLTLISPWIYIAAGVTNHILKTKCADSDNAFEELGCPLPDYFNHNAVMHTIQIFSIIGFFIAEHLSMTRRKNLGSNTIRRSTTSSTIYNDVINSCTVTLPETKVVESVEKLTATEYTDKNKLSRLDDIIHNMTSDNDTHIESDITITSSIGDNFFEEPKFPTCLNYGDTNNRHSLYDNLSS